MTKQLVKRAYKFRFYPTPDQEAELVRTWGCVRFVYNKALAERSRAWTQEQRRVNYADTSKMLTQWKREAETDFLQEVSHVPMQQGLRRLQAAFTNFFEKRAQYPKFKSRHKSKLSLAYMPNGFRFKDGELYIAKCKDPLNVVWSRECPIKSASSINITRDSSGRWFVSILCEWTTEELSPTDKTVGIDLGVKDAIVLHTGERMNPSDAFDVKRKQRAIVRAQKNLSRKAKGSANREKAKRKLARAHRKLSDAKRDWLHQTTTELVRRFDVLSIEDLNVRGMTSAAKGRGRKAKAGLNRGIMQHNFGEFRSMLEYKADWYGRTVVPIDRFYPSSKTCSECGQINTRLRLNHRSWRCAGCNTKHDRDINAAKNINAVGMAVYACGDGVRPAKKPLASVAGNRQ